MLWSQPANTVTKVFLVDTLAFGIGSELDDQISRQIRFAEERPTRYPELATALAGAPQAVAGFGAALHRYTRARL